MIERELVKLDDVDILVFEPSEVLTDGRAPEVCENALLRAEMEK